MQHSNRRLTLFSVMMVVLLLALVGSAFGQGRGRGRRNGRGDTWSNYYEKCAKFRNCHDARSGRWDGRGPRGDRVGNLDWRNRMRHRNRHLDDNNRVFHNRRRNRDHDGRDNFWGNRGRRVGRRVIDNR